MKLFAWLSCSCDSDLTNAITCYAKKIDHDNLCYWISKVPNRIVSSISVRKIKSFSIQEENWSNLSVIFHYAVLNVCCMQGQSDTDQTSLDLDLLSNRPTRIFQSWNESPREQVRRFDSKRKMNFDYLYCGTLRLDKKIVIYVNLVDFWYSMDYEAFWLFMINSKPTSFHSLIVILSSCALCEHSRRAVLIRWIQLILEEILSF